MKGHEPWLVRTALGDIQGPFSEEQLSAKLKDGIYVGDDELCRAGDYWFHLYERGEMVSKLGAEIPVFYPRTVTPEEERTQTETETTAILQTDPPQDPVSINSLKKPAALRKDSRFSLSTLPLGKVLAGIFLIMVVIRLLQSVLQSE